MPTDRERERERERDRRESERERETSNRITISPSSPRQIQIDPNLPSPSINRSITITSPTLLATRTSHRGGMGRSARDDQDARERQMQQDIESAMIMSRARSNSIMADSSPGLRPQLHYPSPIDESTPFPMLSDAEEAEMNRARRSGFRDELHSEDEQEQDHGGRDRYDRERIGDDEEEEDLHQRGDGSGSSAYDSHHRLMRSRSHSEMEVDMRPHNHRRGHSGHGGHGGHVGRGGHGGHRDHNRGMDGSGGMLMSPPTSKTRFDFGAMEDYATREREDLAKADGTWVPTRPDTNGIRQRTSSRPDASQEEVDQPGGQSYDTSMERTHTMSAYGDDNGFSPKESETNSTHAFHRRRQRKLSQSNPLHRRGKLALFEGFGGAEVADTLGPSAIPNGGLAPLKAPRQPKNQMSAEPSAFTAYKDAAPGHDRPYRFSFYSNNLPVTIHARTLAELPAEGQTFEDLFKGRATVDDTSDPDPTGDASAQAASVRKGGDTPTGQDSNMAQPNGKMSLLARAGASQPSPGPASGPGGGGGQPHGSPDDEPEAFTWWLDVLSPTDEEMRMLSKVFGIHPLTTEDILLEETREKIELFRNYYLVCFRSFDQDPYSQTYLEPLNMYIIVFREGTLSFHFRGTPHPQNVRRRIKQLKDYISVTSDWISYALIDDITDAFGPLIQSIEYEVDSIDELVLILKDAEQSDMLRRIGTCRKKVMGLLRLMGNKADVVKGLAKRCNEQWLVAPKSDIGLYLSDIQDHLITMTQNLNHYEKILSRSHSNYLAQISIEMTDANNQINDVLSKLTALGTVLIPMNLVTGLWGMNVHVPGQDIEEGYAWFGGILGCLCAFAILGAFATYKCFVR